MEYVARVPAPALDPIVDDLYHLAGTPPCPRLTIPPMPSALVIINSEPRSASPSQAGARTSRMGARGDVGGQIFEAGLVDEVALDVVPVVFGTGKRYFGPLSKQVLLEDPDEVVQGDRVLHLRFRVRSFRADDEVRCDALSAGGRARRAVW
jgi:hypothetical protein